jgi:ankyrin repeat protein
MLIKWKADVNMLTPEDDKTGERTALMMAAQEGHDKVIRALLDAGADAYVRNSQGHTALWISACKGHVAAVGE